MKQELEFQNHQFDHTLGTHKNNRVLPAAYYHRWGRDLSVEQLVRVKSEKVLKEILSKGDEA